MKKACFIVLLGLSLSACNNYPFHKSPEAVKLAPKPIWGDLIGPDIPLGGDCHIDSINEDAGEGPQNHTVRQSGPALIVTGWGAISVKGGVMASDTAIALKNKSIQGTRRFAMAAKEIRQDVADFFKNQASVDTGFRVAIDISDVSPGEYVLEVIQHKDANNFKCQYTANIVVVK